MRHLREFWEGFVAWLRDLLGLDRPAEERRTGVDRRRRGLDAPMTRRFGLAVAIVTIAWTTFVFSQADKANDGLERETTERQEKDREHVQAICERQERALKLSAQSRRFIRTTDTVLLTLVRVSIDPKTLAERGPLTERQQQGLVKFAAEAKKLERQIVKLRRGEGKLRAEDARLNCDEGMPPPAPSPQEGRADQP